ncbi:hypothetical protein DPX16_14356 [Anabarilius grahami]|uniref:Uncharacterized protein n=1 Tax=Anabarilius grahami TaxID=495550 RepID=A0A3N0XLW8_ANAGA|nr:hypothetical protein DPX16_14356 [Anabarilius grahami]
MRSGTSVRPLALRCLVAPIVLIRLHQREKTSSNLRLLCPYVANLPFSDQPRADYRFISLGSRMQLGTRGVLQFQDAPQQKQALKVCGFAWPAGVHLTQKMHHQIHSKSSRFIPFNQCTPGEQTPARIPTPRREQASGTESADASEGLESADEPCRTERCRPDGMMGRRNEVRWREIFRSQHKGSMVINVDNCFVFDSLGSTSHTIENDCFYVFLALNVFGVC